MDIVNHKCNLTMKSIFRFSLLFLLIVSFVLPCPAKAEQFSLSDMFQQAMADPESATLPALLSGTFYVDPEGFILALVQENEDMLLQYTVCQMVASHNRGSVEYIDLVVSLTPDLAPQGAISILAYLLSDTSETDLANAPEGFTQNLLAAMQHSDGMLTSILSSLLFRLFEIDPVKVVAAIALEDDDFQNFAIISLAHTGSVEKFHHPLSTLTENESLTEAERSIVTQLAAKVDDLEQKAQSAATTAPAEPATEITEPLPTQPQETLPLTIQTEEPVSSDPQDTNYTPILIVIVCAALLSVLDLVRKKQK